MLPRGDHALAQTGLVMVVQDQPLAAAINSDGLLSFLSDVVPHVVTNSFIIYFIVGRGGS